MIRRALIALLTGVIRGYQLIVSPWFAPTCRYYPSCSQYAIDALKVHGPFGGTWRAGWRLLRCNPWSAGGVDPVIPSAGEPEGLTQISTSDPADETQAATQSSWSTVHGNL